MPRGPAGTRREPSGRVGHDDVGIERSTRLDRYCPRRRRPPESLLTRGRPPPGTRNESTVSRPGTIAYSHSGGTDGGRLPGRDHARRLAPDRMGQLSRTAQMTEPAPVCGQEQDLAGREVIPSGSSNLAVRSPPLSRARTPGVISRLLGRGARARGDYGESTEPERLLPGPPSIALTASSRRRPVRSRSRMTWPALAAPAFARVELPDLRRRRSSRGAR